MQFQGKTGGHIALMLPMVRNETIESILLIKVSVLAVATGAIRHLYSRLRPARRTRLKLL